MGRPTKYKEEYNELAFKYCLLGATDKQLAQFFEVNEDSIHEWKKRHPKFSESLKRGKEEADSKVAQSLYRRALGYEHKEDQIFQYQGKPVVVPTIKHYPPDTTAAIFWLKNRQKEHWRDKTESEVTIKENRPLFAPIKNGTVNKELISDN